MTRDNTELARTIIGQFLRGEIEALLANLADDVVWEYGVTTHVVPWYQPRCGRAQVSGFFEALQVVTFERFDVTAWLPHGDRVLLLLDVDYVVNATGRRVVYEDAVMLMDFDAAGRLCRFAHRVDFQQAWTALHGA